MKNGEPPRLSAWLLERLAPRHRRESLVGDLREQLHRGRSVWWYRRQVFGTILAGVSADLAAHKLLALRGLALGWSAFYIVSRFAGPLINQSRQALFLRWGSYLWGDSEVVRQLWVYYGLPLLPLTCAIFFGIGWLVARFHRRHAAAIAVLFSATLLIPATFSALESRRLMETGLWPGWQLGSFRWALVFHASLSFVVYPLCALIGGLWSGPANDSDEFGQDGYNGPPQEHECPTDSLS